VRIRTHWLLFGLFVLCLTLQWTQGVYQPIALLLLLFSVLVVFWTWFAPHGERDDFRLIPGIVAVFTILLMARTLLNTGTGLLLGLLLGLTLLLSLRGDGLGLAPTSTT